MNTRTPINKIENELKKLFDSLGSQWVKVSFILSKIELPLVIKQRKSLYSTDSLLKFYLWKRIKGISIYPNNLEEDDLINLGFDKENGIPTKRAFNKLLQNKLSIDNRELLDIIAEKVLAIATQNKIILDLDIVKKTIKDHKNKIQEQNKAFKEAVKLVKKLVYPQINIKIKNNGKFTSKDLLDVLVYTAYSHDFINNGSKVFTYENNKEVPSGDLILYHFNKLNSTTSLRNTFENILDVIFSFAKRNYNILQRRKLDIAYDIHKIPYYGKMDNFVKGGKHERGTTQFFEFLTCCIVVAGKRFTIDVVPIHPLDNISDLLEDSLIRIKKKVNIEKILIDRGFDNARTINLFKKYNLKFIMPKVRTQSVKSYFDKSEGCKSRVINGFRVGKGENEAAANLVLVDDEYGIKRAFITNLNIPSQLAHHLYSWYAKRWGIETGYRQMDKDFLARTTSKNYIIRLFYFLFSVCLYNLWILVNICVSLTIYGRLKDKPIITAKLFALVLCKVQAELIDPGG